MLGLVRRITNASVPAAKPPRSSVVKICLACSPGGHLVEMQRLMPAFDGKEYFFVTHKSEYSRHLERAYFIGYKEGYIRERITWLKTIFIAVAL